MLKNQTIIVMQNSSVNTSINTAQVKGALTLQTSSLKQKCQAILENYLQGKKVQARQEAAAICKKNPGSLITLHLMTVILYKDGRYREAYREVKKILRKTPDDASRLNLCGLIQRHMMLFDDAIASYQKAIRHKPDFADPYNNLGIIYRYYGDKEKAIRNFRKALDLNPRFASARYNLACMKGYKFSQDEIRLVERQRQEFKLPEDKARLNFALYNAYIKNNEYNRAFAYLEEGNKIIHNNNKVAHALPAYTKEVIKGFDENYAASMQKLAASAEIPVFIVGMPRSGSSLLEQILSSHSNVVGMGESRAMPKLIHTIYRKIEDDTPGFLRTFAEADRKQLENHVEEYEKKALQYVKTESFYTDKMLNNFKYIGFIQGLMPQAKFIHIKRNPMDTCLSCFEKKFTNGHEYTYDLQTLADHFIAYRDLMAHWTRLFPGLIYEINYEDIVSDTKAQIKECLAYLGLRMQKSCLEYYKNKRHVYTASTDQVREKINADSIGKWRRYETELAPLQERFTRAGIEIV